MPPLAVPPAARYPSGDRGRPWGTDPMIRNFVTDPDGRLAEAGGDAPDPAAFWIDLHQPTREEELAAEALVGADIPSPEESAEIEFSSRIFMDGEVALMSLPVLSTSGPHPELLTMTFVLAEGRLVTVRHHETAPIRAFFAAVKKRPELCAGPAETFAGLADAVADRVADQLEETGAALDALWRGAFEGTHASRDLDAILRKLGRSGDVIAKAQESLVGLSRVLTFARALGPVKRSASASRTVKTVSRDVNLLIQHADSLSARLTFLLDATLGMINVEQNAIIKIFSVVAAIFLPPTLIASVYGMNFEHMPELAWHLGYPLALAAMVASMIAPYLWFRRRGWI